MPARWVGAANYRALASAEFWDVVTNTVKYSVGVVVLSQVLGLASPCS
jgi:ABC-type sugar transport systems, permease components